MNRCWIWLMTCAVVLLAGGSTGGAAEPGYPMQPALAGDQLVFVAEGDLWTVRVTDDDASLIAHRLTSDDGVEHHPRFSPDGTMIAFTAQYEGNPDVYIMPATGGSPTRLTYHPGNDTVRGWSPDGAFVYFSSGRQHHDARDELHRVSTAGGLPQRFGFGECTMIAPSASGSRVAFNRWSTAQWSWKRYRGGTAPDIWMGDLESGRFQRLTTDRSNDEYPMWLIGRIFFCSDRDGAPNIHSMSSDGGDVRAHTSFAPMPGDPTAIEGYDLRWPSADVLRRGRMIVFVQGGTLSMLDAANDTVRRLDVRLASDRVARRARTVDLLKTARAMALNHDGSTLLVESRGELFTIELEDAIVRRLTSTGNAREWGADWIDDERIALITDRTGEQQIAFMPADGSGRPGIATEDREDWLFPVQVSPDGNWIAFGDKTMRLHLLNTRTLVRQTIHADEHVEITDYRFSPDSAWLAFVTMTDTFHHQVQLHAIRTGRTFAVSDDSFDDREPRWDPAGRYLYLLSNRHFDPVLGQMDNDHIFTESSNVCALPLSSSVPPPLPALARRHGTDLESWAAPAPAPKPPVAGNGDIEQDMIEQALAAFEPLVIDTDNMAARIAVLPATPGNLSDLEAVYGGVTFIRTPTMGLRNDTWGQTDPKSHANLEHLNCVDGESRTLLNGVKRYDVSGDRSRLVAMTNEGLQTMAVSDDEASSVDVQGADLRVAIDEEWAHIFDEAWRLQRDFYWAPNMVGVDWPAMRAKYAALLPRVATRLELSDLLGELIGELGTSHTYVWPGEQHDVPKAHNVGLLGVDFTRDARGIRIDRILPAQTWDPRGKSPLAAAHLRVSAGMYVVSIDGTWLSRGLNPYAALQGRAGDVVTIRVTDDPSDDSRGRDIKVETIADESFLRYAAWVDANRDAVLDASDGRLGYVHLPDMGTDGLILFARQFYPQASMEGIVVDVRGNSGGYVSQMLIQRLARRPWAYFEPRHGQPYTVPDKTPRGPMAVLIDQHAGSDGDIFPALFRHLQLGPLVGARTWGGVVGMREPKPFTDLGMTSQPEYAWRDAAGWSIENVGVEPDIAVALTPGDRLNQRDPQLDAAIRAVMDALGTAPAVPVDRPSYPVRR
ncbi:MAG: S41 family peptidase [Planctomycetota bacterium]